MVVVLNATLPSHNGGTLSAANHRHNFPGDDHFSKWIIEVSVGIPNPMVLF